MQKKAQKSSAQGGSDSDPGRHHFRFTMFVLSITWTKQRLYFKTAHPSGQAKGYSRLIYSGYFHLIRQTADALLCALLFLFPPAKEKCR